MSVNNSTLLSANLDLIRRQFPALERSAIFFDNPGGTQIAKQSLDRINKYLIESNANHEGAFATSIASDAVLDEAHRAMADFYNAPSAEEIIFGDVTTGASNDLERVTKLARQMVTQFGMSDSLGPLQFGQREEMIFLGREISEQRNYSEEVAREIDKEVRRFIDEAYERARTVLSTYKDRLTAVAQRLMEVETLDMADFAAMLTPAPVAA